MCQDGATVLSLSFRVHQFLMHACLYLQLFLCIQESKPIEIWVQRQLSILLGLVNLSRSEA